MIKNAQPKQGLSSGSVEGAKGGLVSGKERVAMEYAKSLSGAEGPVAQFDAVDEIAAKRVQQAMDMMTFTSPGGVQVFGRNGHFAIISPRQDGGQALLAEPPPKVVVAPWELTVVDADAGTVKIACGTIIKSIVDLTTQITISGAGDTFSPSAGNTIRLKIAGTFTSPTATLEVGGSWTGHPSGIQTTSSGATAAFAALYYPLWQFVGTEADDTVTVKSGLFARRLVGHHHFLRDAAAYQQGLDQPFAVPFLMPYHRALTA